MTTLPEDLQDLLARCLDGGATSDWQALHTKLAAVRKDTEVLDAYAETCALHHDLRSVLAPGASDTAFLRGVESALNEERKNSGRFVLEVTQRTRTQILKRKRDLRNRGLVVAGIAALVLIAAGVYFLRGSTNAPSIGRIVRAGAGVQLTRGTTQRAVNNGETLFGDDIVQMGSAAEGAEIELDEKVTLQASADTVVTLRKGQPHALELQQGKLTVSVGPHPKDHPFIIRTPHADAEVMGTRFALDVDADRTRLDVFESRVKLRMLPDSTSTIVDAGFTAEARPGAAIVAVATNDMPLVAVFQQGKNGYSGTRDAAITNQNAEYSYGNGATDFDANQYLICNIKEYQERALLCFDGLTLPPRAKVVSAQLDLKWENWETAHSLRGAYLNVAWNPKARDVKGLGWLHRDVGADWAKPGAGDDKNDRVPGLSITLPTPGDGYVTKTMVTLDPAQVQRWVDSPATNHGIIIWFAALGDQVRFFGSHATEPKNRPALIIRYTVPH